MTRLGLCLLALLAAGGLSDPVKKVVTPKVALDTQNEYPKLHYQVRTRLLGRGRNASREASHEFLEKQIELMALFDHIHEPIHIESCKLIASTWSLAENVEHFGNSTAVKLYVHMLKGHWVLPRAMPFSIHEHTHKFEASTLFNVLYSAKDYQTLYKAAVYLRDLVNENLYVYVLSAVIIHRHDLQGFILPPIYEVLPEYFNNGEILTTAQRINVHGDNMIEHYPSTYKWDENIVIRWNTTVWPYHNKNTPMWYFLNDYGLNAFYYYYHLEYPQWLGGDVVPLVKDRRGEHIWFLHRQMMARYYMERLSNGLGEVEELGLEVVEQGYESGLLYHNGVPFPVRPNHFHIEQPEFVEEIEKIQDYERRIRDAIESGYIINSAGEHIDIRSPEAIDILGRVIESNVDSPNMHYYKDFISIWKSLLGNSISHEHQYHKDYIPLVVPSTLEHYWTAVRDPAFYMIWKRVLNLFSLWHKKLPLYKNEELALPSVAIEKVETDKLVTFFENTYMNITSSLHLNEHEIQHLHDDVSVLVQHPRLNHKKFNIRVHVKSEVAKTVLVKFFLAPKYDSHGNEIPLHLNCENFFMMDQFTHDLVEGESVIVRESTQNHYGSHDWTTAHEVYHKALNAYQGKGEIVHDQSQWVIKCPERLLLPKGRAGGMPFVLMVYISEYHAPKVPYGTGFDPSISYGLGSGARVLTDERLGFPVDRPLHPWQVKNLPNMEFQEVLIYHKHTPEVVVPHAE